MDLELDNRQHCRIQIAVTMLLAVLTAIGFAWVAVYFALQMPSILAVIAIVAGVILVEILIVVISRKALQRLVWSARVDILGFTFRSAMQEEFHPWSSVEHVNIVHESLPLPLVPMGAGQFQKLYVKVRGKKETVAIDITFEQLQKLHEIQFEIS